MKQILLAIVLVVGFGFTLVSCGKGGVGNPFGDWDPLAGMPDHIRNAKPGFEKSREIPVVEAEMPITSNQPYFLFLEGESGQATVFGRVLREGYDAKLAIKNINEFPGASFDPTTGTFRWAPTPGMVAAESNVLELTLWVQITATNGTEVISREKGFPLLVQKKGIQAAVIRDTLQTQFVREGSTQTFDVVVQYRAAGPSAPPPDLMALIQETPSVYDEDLSKFVKQRGNPRQEPGNPMNWIYSFEINLYKAELTKNSEDFTFQIVFMNTQGLASIPKEFQVQVRTNLEYIQTNESYYTRHRVKAGTTISKDLIMYDPKQEGILFAQLNAGATLPLGMTVNCNPGNHTSTYICRVDWAVDPATPAGTRADLSFKARSTSQAVGDNYFVEDTFTIKFEVEAP